MIMNPADIEASVDAWFERGANASVFNGAAKDATPTVNMTPANDVSRPGILGYNR